MAAAEKSGSFGPLQLATFFLLAMLACSTAAALGRDRTIAQLHHTVWTVKDGAPADIWALVQSRDGYLWLGTGTGLYRFDGVRFERFEPRPGEQFRSNNVTALTLLPSGDIWIGFFYGGASVLSKERLAHYTEQDGFPHGMVIRLAQDQDGVLWAAARGGLARFEKGRWRTIGNEWNYPSARADWVFVDPEGTLWVTTGDTLMFLRKGARRFEPTGEKVGIYAVLTRAPDGVLWLSDGLRGTRALPDFTGSRDRPVRKTNVPRTNFTQSKRIIFDRDGSLWGTDASLGGIYRVASSERFSDGTPLKPGDAIETFAKKDGLTADVAVPILEDREGNIWVGTNLGLNRFRYNDFVVPSEVPTALPSGFALAAGDDAGRIWIASGGTLLRMGQDSAQVVLRGLPEITSAHYGPDGVLWLVGPDGLRRFDGARLSRISLPENQQGNIHAMASDRAGGLWVALVNRGVYHLADGAWKAWSPGAALSTLTPNAIATDSSARAWFAYSGSRIVLREGDSVRTFSSGHGLQIGNVITINASGHDVLIGGETGLARFKGGRFHSLTGARTNALNGISGIVETPDADVWLNTSKGVVRISGTELRQAFQDPDHRMQYQLFDFQDGLPGIALQANAVPTATEGLDGRLWFATNQGIAWIDPKRIHSNPIPPPVAIRSVTVNGKPYPPAPGLQLPKRTSNLHIDYTATSLSIPERVRFRYRLHGMDEDWQDVGTRRAAFYTNLGPGHYRFDVIAANDDGVWNKKGASLDFAILPMFHQTKWFMALCVTAGIGALVLMYLLRLKQVAARVRDRLEERHMERERIARELHDTLLQGIQGLVLKFHAVAEKIPPHEPTRMMIDKALDRADDVLVEGRDRVRDLRATAKTISDLPHAFAQLGEELAQDHPARFRVVVEGSPRALDPVTREEIYGIGREALVNAFRHANAGEIEVEITHRPAELRLRFRDDGIGIDPTTLDTGSRPGHWGLSGMRERASRIGAQLSIWVRSGSGTEVDLRIPAAAAYRGGSDGAWWSWLRRVISGGRQT